jgi:hypothetical protein
MLVVLGQRWDIVVESETVLESAVVVIIELRRVLRFEEVEHDVYRSSLRILLFILHPL